MKNLIASSLESNTLGAVLNITRISRKHMGVYLCEANNGIPPAASRDFEIEVHCEQNNLFKVVFKQNCKKTIFQSLP